MNVTEQHLHHMAKRHHSTMRKLDALRERFSGATERVLGTLEVGAGALAAGVIDGRTDNGTVLHVPISLGVGAALLVAGHLDLAGASNSAHLNNLGNGFIANYASAKGHAFGSQWRATGKLFAGKAAAPALPTAAAAGDMADALAAVRAAQAQHGG